ncbi:MAG: hypothetical protein JO231_19785, partial [Acidobacteria bacterium]|nr:hypothetical protein [Acidobacteriota bacterium]
VPLSRGLNLQMQVAVFNVTNVQTGYDYETRISNPSAFIRRADASAAGTPVIDIPDSISDAALQNLLTKGVPFVRADWAVKAPQPKTFYAPRRYQLTARIQF